MKSGIYCIRNITNNKVYIGSTYNLIKRFWTHKDLLNKGLHPNQHLQTSWNKYGSSSFEFTVIEKCPIEMLIAKEDIWISFYNSLNREKGYNICFADRHDCSEETRRKIGDGNRGKTISYEARLKISNTLTGIKKSEEMRRKLRNANLGKKHSEETKQKMRAAKIGKKMSEKARINMSLARTGANNHMFGKKMSAESTRKRLETRARNKLLSNPSFVFPQPFASTSALPISEGGSISS